MLLLFLHVSPTRSGTFVGGGIVTVLIVTVLIVTVLIVTAQAGNTLMAFSQEFNR